MDKFTGTFWVVVSDAPAAAAATLQANNHVTSFSISDTAANVQTTIDALNGDSKLSSISFTDAGTPSLTLSYTQYSADTSALSKFQDNFNLNVSDVPVSAATELQADSRVTSVSISDTADHVAAGLDALNSDSKISTIAFIDSGTPSLSITYTQYTNDSAAIGKFTGSYGLVISGAPVSGATTLQADSHVTSFSISDTAAHVAAGLDALNGESKVSSITLSGGNPLIVTALQNQTDLFALAALVPGAVVDVCSVGTPTTTTMVAFNGSNGQYPYGSLISDAAGNFYGTTWWGGANGGGEVFELVNDGGVYDEATLFSFNGANGWKPFAGLIIDTAGNLYGTTQWGGLAGSGQSFPASGVVFELANNNGFYTETTLITFHTSNGSEPCGKLYMDTNGNLFGTTYSGSVNLYFGNAGYHGVVFELQNNNGVYYENILTSFDGNNGSAPRSALISDVAGNLYGTTEQGGAYGYGVVFELAATDGPYAETTLVSFNGNNGAYPTGDLIADPAGNLFGATGQGGAYGFGEIFELVKFRGSYTEKILISFESINTGGPTGSLIVDAAGNLFGTTAGGYGTAFELANRGGTYTEITLVSFDGSNGAAPNAGLTADAAGNLYGTTSAGGSENKGTVFKITNTGFVVATTTLASNTASVSAGLSAPSMTFLNTPSNTTLASTSPEIVNATLSSSIGIQEIANFCYLTDELVISLNGASYSLFQAADTSVNGVNAISLYSSADPTHGIILTGMIAGQTASDLLTNHTTFTNGCAVIT